jgi:DNA topoisomerase IB
VGGRAPHSPLSAAFHQVPSFRGRLDMVNAAAGKALVNLKAAEEWADIYKAAVKRANRRNALAHSVVHFEPAVKAPGRRLYLHPSVFDDLRGSRPRAEADKITVKEMREMRRSFAELHRSLNDFQFKLLWSSAEPT